ncbi:MAG: ParB/RepB/Spo0J family partition protein [Tepidisphaeraceae bacterium]
MSRVTQAVDLAMEQICPDLEQVRTEFDEQAIVELAASIQAQGLLQPIRVRPIGPDVYQIINGERRYRAFRHLKRKTIPAFVVSDELAASDVTEQMLIENSQRVGLNPMDQARAYQRLMQETEWTAAKVAERVGVAPATVSRHLKLLDLDPAIQQAVADHKLPASTAYELAAVEDDRQRQELARQALNGAITRESVTRARRTPHRDPVTAPFARTTLVIDAARSVTIGAAAPTLDSLLAVLEDAVSQLKKARGKGISIQTLVRMLKEQARLATTVVVQPNGGAQ